MNITCKKLMMFSFLLLGTSVGIYTSVYSSAAYHSCVEIVGHSVDNLVLKGIQHILKNGEEINSRAGKALQAYNVSYTLLDPRNKLHNLRAPESIQYFCRELLAYFNGSLNVKDGLAQASKVWEKLADKDGNINSNYGYYVFHQKNPKTNMTQYDWVIHNLIQNLDSRKAYITINQLHHQDPETKDYPCTRGMQFFIKKGDDNLKYVCCVVSSRSTDVYTGLPYDIGFFAFVTELIWVDLCERLPNENLQLGYVTMKTDFTQIYDKTKSRAIALLQPPTACRQLAIKLPAPDDQPCLVESTSSDSASAAPAPNNGPLSYAAFTSSEASSASASATPRTLVVASVTPSSPSTSSPVEAAASSSAHSSSQTPDSTPRRSTAPAKFDTHLSHRLVVAQATKAKKAELLRTESIPEMSLDRLTPSPKASSVAQD